MNGSRDIVFKRCGCADEHTGRQLAGHCPQLAEPGHGSWYYVVQVTTVGGRKARFRRGGFPTREAAVAARQAILDGPADRAAAGAAGDATRGHNYYRTGSSADFEPLMKQREIGFAVGATTSAEYPCGRRTDISSLRHSMRIEPFV